MVTTSITSALSPSAKTSNQGPGEIETQGKVIVQWKLS